MGHLNHLYLPILLLRMLFPWVDNDRDQLMYIVEIKSR